MVEEFSKQVTPRYELLVLSVDNNINEKGKTLAQHLPPTPLLLKPGKEIQ